MDRQLQERLSKKFADMKIDERIDLLLMHYADNKNNSRLTDEQTQLIDHLFDGYYPLLFGDELNATQEYDYRNQVLDIMIEEGIISGYEDFGKTATLTAFGHRTNERGGWLKHVEREEADRTLVATASKTSIRTSWGALFFISITAFFTWQTNNISQKELDIQIQKTAQDSIAGIQQNQRANLLKHNVDSLFLQVDRLQFQVSSIKKKIGAD